ncbi:tRNA 2-selenouridine(34) synthase MnmH [Hylemonella sp. W303a]|uniref:tRNA 2-selenouridine(34) synthase MnmH n=1 Tax=Hylemonella sp. W303a TaxID=3389873 RepID=UPI00396B3485
MLQTLSAEDALRRLDDFDAVLDARSESEYAEDHLPEALNWPTLNDRERHEVGLLHRSNPFEARKRGAMIAARNIAAHIEREVLQKPKDWKPLVYCWRGGKRSGSLALILGEIGFYVTRIDGGYKAFRNALLADIPRLAAGLDWRVICGATGSGKTRLLHALREVGAQTLDLEALARHRSSVLGALPGQPQPTQKAFDTQIWDALRRFDPARPVYVESESKKVGNVAVPDALMAAMRAAPCLHLLLPEDERVALLLEDYPHYARDAAEFCARLDALTELRGKKTVTHWQDLVQSGQLQEVVRELLRTHYDPGYRQSSLRNFARFADAPELHPRDRSMASMRALAGRMLEG